ncbi:MAG: hypothetical protein J6A89_05480 [Clostridia bacterium]|nr:hypothetical protein [Clostridia bacterium]
MYKLIHIDENGKQKNSEIRITDDNIEEIRNIGEFFFSVMQSIDYFNIVNDNLKELMDAIKKLSLNEPKNFSKINRYFINMSNSFYMFQCFYEKKFKNLYKPVFSYIYDKYDDYVLMYNLRNYAVHNTLVITKLTLDIISGESKIIIKPTELIKDKKNLDSKCKKIINGMISKNEEINVKFLVGSFFSIFNELQVKLMNQFKTKIEEGLQKIKKYLIGRGMNKLDSFIIDESGDVIYSPSSIFYSLFTKLEKEYTFDYDVQEYLKKYYNM